MSTTTGHTPGDDITIRGLTWPKLLTIIGAILLGAGGIIWVLVGLVYGGLQERLDALAKRVQGVEDTFRTTLAAGVSVQDLLARAPRLEDNISTTRTDVAAIKVALEALQRSQKDDAAEIKRQLQALQDAEAKTRDATASHAQQLQDLLRLLRPPGEPRPR